MASDDMHCTLAHPELTLSLFSFPFLFFFFLLEELENQMLDFLAALEAQRDSVTWFLPVRRKGSLLRRLQGSLFSWCGVVDMDFLSPFLIMLAIPSSYLDCRIDARRCSSQLRAGGSSQE